MRSPLPVCLALACMAGFSTRAADSLGRNLQPGPKPVVLSRSYPGHGSIERLDPALDALIAPDARMERLAEGFNWSEGPTWLRRQRMLVFSDVPENVIYGWSESAGITTFLKPSGYTGTAIDFREQGSNGLTTDRAGNLVICQHGDRRISRLEGNGRFTPLARYFNHRRFNSPNDLVHDRKGNLYFTDPPYGLHGLNQSPLKELLFNGVYVLRPNGKVELLHSGMTFPNGIALSPDERTLYVNQSDPKSPVVMSFPVKPDGTLGEGKVFFDTTPLAARGGKGLPDGLKVDVHGNLFATGPGGVLVINPEGTLLGVLNTGEATGNCCWGDDGSTLYITADMYLLRIRTLTRGSDWNR